MRISIKATGFLRSLSLFPTHGMSTRFFGGYSWNLSAMKRSSQTFSLSTLTDERWQVEHCNLGPRLCRIWSEVQYVYVVSHWQIFTYVSRICPGRYIAYHQFGSQFLLSITKPPESLIGWEIYSSKPHAITPGHRGAKAMSRSFHPSSISKVSSSSCQAPRFMISSQG